METMLECYVVATKYKVYGVYLNMEEAHREKSEILATNKRIRRRNLRIDSSILHIKEEINLQSLNSTLHLPLA